VQLRGVVRQGWVCDRCRGQIPLYNPEETKEIVSNRKKSGRNRTRS
jgi:hypothetical protein